MPQVFVVTNRLLLVTSSITSSKDSHVFSSLINLHALVISYIKLHISHFEHVQKVTNIHFVYTMIFIIILLSLKCNCTSNYFVDFKHNNFYSLTITPQIE